ncbi:MAG TPA: XRE family transcriptional regulator [Streptosporangiaceae bacterium]|nr:XRE family transcriptional regulator [Streptosporangiaceae bacterium]
MSGQRGPVVARRERSCAQSRDTAETVVSGIALADGDVQKEAIIARRIRAKGLVAGATAATIAAAIHDECEPIFGTTWIRAYRLACGTALADIVEQVKAWYEHEGRSAPRFSETLLSAYESGNKRPGPEYLHYLCSVYRAEPTDLGYSARCFCGRDHRCARPADDRVHAHEDGLGGGTADGAHGPASGPDRGTARGAARGAAGGARGPAGGADGKEGANAAPASTASGVRDHFGGTGEEHEDVLRRTLLQMIAGAGVCMDSRLIGAADGVRRHLDGALLRSGVAATMLDQWEEAAASYGRQYMTVAPLRLLCDVLLDLGDVRRMCEQRQSIEAQERLCRLAAQLAALSGMTMIDVGDQRLARSFFRTARTAADETGDRALRAWVVAREGLVPLYYGDAREALRLARISQDLAGRTPCAAGAMAPMIEARALAKSDPVRSARTDRAQRAITRAHAVFGQLTEDQRADTAFGYTERQLLFHEGEALAELGAAGADRVLANALAAYPATERLDRSLIRFDRAMFRLVRGDVDEAVRIGEETIKDLPADHRAEIVLNRARDLACAAVAKSGDETKVQGLRDHIAALPAAMSA